MSSESDTIGSIGTSPDFSEPNTPIRGDPNNSSNRPFVYSLLFKIVTYSDLILTIFLWIVFLYGTLFNRQYYQMMFVLWLIYSVNLVLDVSLLKNRVWLNNRINLKYCWLKTLFGFIGIFTIISGLYFLIVSFKMQLSLEDERGKKRLAEEKSRSDAENREREAYIESQNEKGLVLYKDKNGREHWKTPEEIEQIRKKEEAEKIQASLLYRVTESIRSFKPTRQWGNENNYHIELLGWLNQEFPGIVGYEIQSGYSRPDLSIKDIAIEIKGPTDNQGLNTLASKLLRYEQYYSHIVIVLFECNFSEGVYRELVIGIERHFKNVTIIRK